MKKFVVVAMLLALAQAVQAQHVRVRLGFPASVGIRAGGPAPFAGAIWIGPEWQWRGGQYVAVPGYWARPRGHRSYWVQGHWKYTRRGYRWVPGHWR